MWRPFSPPHSHKWWQQSQSLASSRDHTEFVIFRKAFNCCFDFKMQMWGEGKKREQVSKYLHCLRHRGKKDQWESFNPENAKGLSLTCCWGFSGGSGCWSVMLGQLTAGSCAAPTVCQGLCRAEFPCPWAWHIPSLRWGKRQSQGKAELLWSSGTWCSVFALAHPQLRAGLYWDSWASTDARIPPWWRGLCKAPQVQPRLHRSFAWAVTAGDGGWVSLWAGPGCLQQGTGRGTLGLCLNPKGNKRLRW